MPAFPVCTAVCCSIAVPNLYTLAVIVADGRTSVGFQILANSGEGLSCLGATSGVQVRVVAGALFSELGDYISGRLMEWRDMILWWAQTKLKSWASSEITLFSMLSNTSSLPLYSWLPTSLKQQIQNYPIQSYPAVTVADLFFPYNEDVMKRTDICHRSLLLYTLGFYSLHYIMSNLKDCVPPTWVTVLNSFTDWTTKFSNNDHSTSIWLYIRQL